MLSVARQRATTIPTTPLLLVQLFSSSSFQSQKSTRQRIAKEKVRQRYDKILKKRQIKEMRRERMQESEERKQREEARRNLEVKEKQVYSKELSDLIPSFTEEQLESMYKSLLSARPEELSNDPQIAAPSSAPTNALLADPRTESQERRDRLEVLEQRLDQLELEEGELVEKIEKYGEGSSRLSERLRRKSTEETSTERDGSRIEEEGKPQLALETTQSPAIALLDRIESISKSKSLALEPQASTSATSIPMVPMGLLARSEWNDLVLACAEEGDSNEVIRALEAMKTVPLTDGEVLEDVLALYAVEGRPQDAVKLTNFARQNDLPLSVTAHHHLLTSVLPSHPELAIKHLYSMESLQLTPLASTYTSVISRLLHPTSPPELIRKGWDLYAHSRLVSYPTPSVELYSTMIQACSRGLNPSPERAIDLFTELVDDNRLPPSELAYNGVIRACSREGSQEYYFEALRYMRRMLDDNVVPSRYTFHAVLEGCKRHGDLPRARWILVKMVGIEGGREVKPNENTVGLVFQSYAAFRPEGGRGGSKVGKKARKKVGETAKSDVDSIYRPSTILKPSQDPTNLPLSTTSSSTTSQTSSTTGDNDGSLALIELLGESSLFYPGPLPTTSAEVLEEARNVMLQIVQDPSIVDHNDSSPSASNETPPPPPPTNQPSMFPEVQPSTFLYNSYLSILNSHSPTIDHSFQFFNEAFDRSGIEKNRYTFEVMLKRCQVEKNRVSLATSVGKKGDEEGKVVEMAKRVFQSWLEWSNAVCPAVQRLRERTETGETIEDMELERVEKEAKNWEKERRNGRNISKMWSGYMRVLAKAYREEEALTVLRRFVELYPPSNIANYRPSVPSLAVPDKSVTRISLQLSSSLYPETSPSHQLSLPPYLSFEDLKLLHLRFANVEDKKGLSFVKGISKAYESGLVHFKRWERQQRG